MKLDAKSPGWRKALQHLDDGGHATVIVESDKGEPGRAIVGLRELISFILAPWVKTITLSAEPNVCRCITCIKEKGR